MTLTLFSSLLFSFSPYFFFPISHFVTLFLSFPCITLLSLGISSYVFLPLPLVEYITICCCPPSLVILCFILPSIAISCSHLLSLAVSFSLLLFLYLFHVLFILSLNLFSSSSTLFSLLLFPSISISHLTVLPTHIFSLSLFVHISVLIHYIALIHTICRL